MPKFGPIKRKDLIRYLQKHDFKDVFKKFLKEGVKDDCHENFFLKPLVQKRASNNE